MHSSMADPTTVLSAITTGMGALQVRAPPPPPRLSARPPACLSAGLPAASCPTGATPAWVQVSSVPTSSEPTTPSSESPLSLEAGLRDWLNDTLLANSGAVGGGGGGGGGLHHPKVYAKLLVSNAAAGSVIGKASGAHARHTLHARLSSCRVVVCVGGGGG